MMRVRRRGPVALLVTLAVACGTDAPGDPVPSPSRATAPAPGTAVGIPDPDTIDPARLEPLAGLPPCPDTSSPSATTALPRDVPLPPAAEVANASADGSLVSVQGTAARTPVEIMVDYLGRPGLEVVAAEDEVFESEVLLVEGDLRVFVKSQATCARGSAFVLFASTDPALVPVPAGTGP